MRLVLEGFSDKQMIGLQKRIDRDLSAKSRACPYCKAIAGAPCRKRSGAILFGEFHKARRK